MMQFIRPIASGVIIAAIAYGFLSVWMHAPAFVSVSAAALLGVSVLAINGSGPKQRDDDADRAWLEAAPDLPPSSERAQMERAQEAIPHPVPAGGVLTALSPAAPSGPPFATTDADAASPTGQADRTP